MPKLTNSRHEAFAMAVASGAPLSDAYEDAGFHGESSRAGRLARRARVMNRVDEFRQEQADLDEARPTSVIVSLVRIARAAESLNTAAGAREARLTLLEARRLYAAQIKGRQDVRLTVLDDDEWDAVFRSVARSARGDAALMTTPMTGQ